MPDDTDPLHVWRECGKLVGGLVADFAAEAVRAVWRDGRLDVALPAESAAAATFLRGADVTAGLQRALAALVGRPVKVAVEIDPPRAAAEPAPPGGGPDPGRGHNAVVGPPAPRPPQSQSALIREAASHPLVEQARALFDAAILKVDPPRPRAEAPAAPAVHAGPAPAGSDQETSDG